MGHILVDKFKDKTTDNTANAVRGKAKEYKDNQNTRVTNAKKRTHYGYRHTVSTIAIKTQIQKTPNEEM